MAAIPINRPAFDQQSFNQPFSGQINYEPLPFPETALFSNQQRATSKRSPLFVGMITLLIIIMLGTTSTALFAFSLNNGNQAEQPLQTPTQVVFSSPTHATTSTFVAIITPASTLEPTPTVLPTPTPFVPTPTAISTVLPTPTPVKPTPTPGVTPTMVLPTPSATPSQSDCTLMAWQQVITLLPGAKNTFITKGDFTVTTRCNGPLSVKMLEMPDYPTDVRACKADGTCGTWQRITSTEKGMPLISRVPTRTVYHLEFRSNRATSNYVLAGVLSY